MTGSSGEGRLVRLKLCPAFSRPDWRVPTEVPGARVLIGWDIEPPPVDGGVPPTVADILVRGLCRQAALTYPCGRGAGKGAIGKRLRAGRDFDWKSTQDAHEAIPEIFESAAFPWELQGQVVVLSTPGTPLALDEHHLNVVARPELFGTLHALGATGLLLPGVDGDVAALYTFASGDMPTLTGVLSALADESGADCVSLSEADFARPGALPG
ncbi:MAG TPA: hypothetical protein VHO67_19980 [Polyangia bacterium]|nr:hypothetical protein [Polyangia bacterium]